MALSTLNPWQLVRKTTHN